MLWININANESEKNQGISQINANTETNGKLISGPLPMLTYIHTPQQLYYRCNFYFCLF